VGTIPNQQNIGVGLGLRQPHYSHILENQPQIAWFEAISENYIGLGPENGGNAIQILERIRALYPLGLHGVSLSIGSTDELDLKYLTRLNTLIERIEPLWVSDHLCWTGAQGENLHDLLPLPYTEEVLRHLSERILKTQDFLKRPLVFENVSAYLCFEHSEMTEWEFLNEITQRTDCGLLIDVNNIFVSSANQSFDPMTYLKSIPKHSVKQMHLAGHSRQGECLIDTHDGPVSDRVWELYSEAIKLYGPVPTLIEWDDKIPDFEILAAEASRAENLQQLTLKEAHGKSEFATFTA
jgi:uncharacterized protein (UPF0276 family)